MFFIYNCQGNLNKSIELLNDKLEVVVNTCNLDRSLILIYDLEFE